jgi:hypothetical protein
MSKENTSDADINIDSLVNQLKDSTTVSNKIQTNEDLPVEKDDIEDFVIQNSSKLITQSLEVMESVKDYIMASGDPDSISSLADLINASSKSIESLNKLVVQNKRTATTLLAKKMDVEAKYAIEEKKNENTLLCTREEVFKRILNDATVIDAEEGPPVDTNSDQES